MVNTNANTSVLMGNGTTIVAVNKVLSFPALTLTGLKEDVAARPAGSPVHFDEVDFDKPSISLMFSKIESVRAFKSYLDDVEKLFEG